MAKEIILSAEELKEVAEHLSMGLECYYNIKTGVIKAFVSEEFAEPGDFEDDMREIKKDRSDFFQFTAMTSKEEYNLMLEFSSEEVDDEQLKEELLGILEEPKPFKSFKWLIEESDYREDWYEYKESCYMDFVSEQLV